MTAAADALYGEGDETVVVTLLRKGDKSKKRGYLRKGDKYIS